MLSGKSVSFKNEMLFERGISYNDLPAWQKRGVGLYYKMVPITGFDPVRNVEVKVERRRLKVDFDLPKGDEYGDWVCRFLE